MTLRHGFAAALLLAACAQHKHEASPDADVTPPFAEASHEQVPQMVNAGGQTLSAPKVVPIFFAGDQDMQHETEKFLVELADSPYWTATTSEYGVGRLAIGYTIVTPSAPPTSDTALTTWLAAQFGTPGWPAKPEAQAIYSVFLPDGVVLHTSFGDSCASFGAYHDEAQGTHNESIIYALMPRCDYGGGAQGKLDALTESASHEFIEAVTDPHVQTTPAFGTVDDAHAIWGITPGAEVGDMCEYVDQAYQPLVGNYMVQRTWSNASASAGKDPCVPASAPYLGIAPVLDESLSLSAFGSAVTTKGVKISKGASKTIEVDLFSDVETAAWTVEATDAAAFGGGSSPELSFAWDKTTGANGDKLMLTITRVADGQYGGSEFVLSSKRGRATYAQWWGFVGN